ncbi:hypothetical protein HDR58_09915 [bacterium]|nr:hypothetical protein [bacterium]
MEKINLYTRILITLRFLWNFFSGCFVLSTTLIAASLTDDLQIRANYCISFYLIYIIIGIILAILIKIKLKEIDKHNFQFILLVFNLIMIGLLLLITVY